MELNPWLALTRWHQWQIAMRNGPRKSSQHTPTFSSRSPPPAVRYSSSRDLVHRYIWIWSVVPIGAMFAMTLWLGNTAYLYIFVAFGQMLKAIILALWHPILVTSTVSVAVFVLGSISWT